jgi:hypothetical protein
MSFIVLIILSNVRITRKQAVLLSFEFISRLPSLTNLTSIICAPLISDLFVLHDITFFSSSSEIYIYCHSFIHSDSIFFLILQYQHVLILVYYFVNPKKERPEEQKKTDGTIILNHMMSCVCVFLFFEKKRKSNVVLIMYFFFFSIKVSLLVFFNFE